MAEPIKEVDTTSFTLSQFLTEIKQTIDRKFKGGGYWVRGELSDWHKNGAHYYGELIEFNENTHQSIAKVRINMWANVAHKVMPKFHHATGEQLKNGMKVLLMVDVNFHQNFGLSLNVIDIDPSFTLGDREARKKKVIADLTQSGVINNNRNLAIPTEFTNIAVISSENAAGLGDFFAEADLLQKHGLCQFDIYHASMQGKDCPTTVAKQFREIYKAIGSHEKAYDCIVLIRGGGSQADLDWFNYFEVANALCYMPVPVFVGIGHERDKTILDDLATRSFDTPSKVINYIANTITNNAVKAQTSFTSLKSIALNSTTKAKADIDKHHQYITHFAKQVVSSHKKVTGDYYKLVHANAKQQLAYQRQVIDNWQSNIMQSAKKSLELSRTKIDHLNQTAMTTAKSLIQSHSKQLSTWHSNIAVNAKNTLINAKNSIESHYRGILSMSIEPTLQRGFAVTKSGDKYVTSIADAKQCQSLTVTYHDGELITEVKHG
ncbi:MAG: exodeoxyribonuclease VII large subunit [Proteobacteria bacterium]|nr:exodeoxyribonuclease VII large subunit [Pseudomonadota bacterium]